MEISVLLFIGIFWAMGAWYFYGKHRPKTNDPALIVPNADELVVKTITSVKKVDDYLGYPHAQISFEDETESLAMAPSEILEKVLPWSFEAKWAYDAPLGSSKAALETYLSVHTDAVFHEDDEDWQWIKDGHHFSLAVEDDWLLFTMSDFAEIPDEEPTLSFSAYDEDEYEYDSDNDFCVEGPVLPNSRRLWIEPELLEREEADSWLASYPPELLQRIANYCYYGDGEVIVTKSTVIGDFAVGYWDALLLEDVIHETQEIARRVKGLSPLQRDDLW
ncbi:hypothetical protein FRD01_19335 [Microvenator marinus]|uniref:Uncharacterized protein n=1 Tax=Microvenator marinus TaxID=2600177 RepID=A0A5B8XVX0_9DELT|nr:hypothetical protein [Microvenator marinus]QED29347.1 hypothetical protein FRD01_19335 [Microvenator marinus]